MTTFGYTLMTEEHGPGELVTNARRAEEMGFDFLVASDHYHPWVPQQQHSPYAWSVLGAVAAVTERGGLMTMVTCPHRLPPRSRRPEGGDDGPAERRALHPGAGRRRAAQRARRRRGWPGASGRHEMLTEAVEIIRLLWEGGYVDHRGTHFAVEDARVFDLPEAPVPTALAASGSESVQLAARLGDGIVATEPDADLVDEFRQAHKGSGSTWNQIPMCWGADADEALERAHHSFRWSALGWKVQARAVQSRELRCRRRPGPARGSGLDYHDRPRRAALPRRGREVAGAGYDSIALVQIGEDQDGFFRFWQDELGPALRERNG
jgi:alkanesulfonate monooxygenase SsuD/methylene tetrahydromethanopterin reductase-like flavin-dependent oxidoreductase (luciferase family)